ncbi:hypothetical protein O3P69_013352 [Scylla paramamosain]|uniref:Uncharacterized protein n=1 Tax=Scylla paramamosain TaxID=85552 RepID=A0AAW0U333_SCYPA
MTTSAHHSPLQHPHSHREEKREVICHTILGGKRSGSSVLHISLPEEMSFHCLTFPKIYCFLSCHPLLIL